MVPLTFAGKVLVPDPFWIVLITLVMQCFALKLGDGVLKRMRSDLRRRGVENGEPMEAALRGAQGFSLLNVVYAGVLPLLGALMISLIGVKANNTLPLSVIYLVIMLVSFGLIGIFIVSLVDLFDEFNVAEPTLPWTEKLLARLGIKSYGDLYGWVAIMLTFLIQLMIAYLQLPDVKVQ